MKHQKHLDFLAHWPKDRYPRIMGNQESVLRLVGNKGISLLLELPTGTGKTAIGYTFLKTLEVDDRKSLFYITPNKTLVDQIKKLHPDVKVMYGRNEYPCLYYQGEISAEAAACSLLNCPHRVDAETGETEVVGVEPCPYLLEKWKAKQGGIVVCTMAFYLFTHLFSEEWGETAGLVIDEAHQIAKAFRNSLSYEITDYHLERAVELFQEAGIKEGQILENFRRKMMQIVKRRQPGTATLLKPEEINNLLIDLYGIDSRAMMRSVRQAMKAGKIDALKQRDTLKRAEAITRNLTRYLKSLEFSLETDDRKPLNYTYGYYEQEIGENHKVQYRLVIKAYYVAPLIKKVLAPWTLAYSATIGDPEIFGFESGIRFPFHAFESDFPAKNTKIFLPTDTPNLAVKARNRQDVTRSLRKIAKACKSFQNIGMRSLVVVVSNQEREKFLMLAAEEGVDAISYGNGVKPREAAKKFQQGEGSALVGTVANYGEGVDLPKNLAPVIFFLRPAYPNPNDPASIFEEKRFGSLRWKLWNWRVMIEALQVRGRNIRSVKDLGVTIFVSQQFRRFVPAVFPEWLKDAYQGDLRMEDCVNNAKKLLS